MVNIWDTCDDHNEMMISHNFFSLYNVWKHVRYSALISRQPGVITVSVAEIDILNFGYIKISELWLNAGTNRSHQRGLFASALLGFVYRPYLSIYLSLMFWWLLRNSILSEWWTSSYLDNKATIYLYKYIGYIMATIGVAIIYPIYVSINKC